MDGIKTRMMDGIKFEVLEDGQVIAHGSKGDKYTVTLKGESTEDSCTCLGWKHRMARPEGSRDCLHVRAARRLAARTAARLADPTPMPLEEPSPVLEMPEPEPTATKAKPKTYAVGDDDELTVDEEVDLLMKDAEKRRR